MLLFICWILVGKWYLTGQILSFVKHLSLCKIPDFTCHYICLLYLFRPCHEYRDVIYNVKIPLFLFPLPCIFIKLLEPVVFFVLCTFVSFNKILKWCMVSLFYNSHFLYTLFMLWGFNYSCLLSLDHRHVHVVHSLLYFHF